MNLAFRIAQGGVRTDLPASLAINPALATWLQYAGDGCFEIRSGKVELGQGIMTALAQIAAEELCVPLARIRMVPASTALSPDEAVTSGSLSIQESGVAIRLVCAEVRERLLERAAVVLRAVQRELVIVDGVITHPGSNRSVAYADLAVNEIVDGEASGKVAPKTAAAHVVVGRSVARLDLPGKVAGAPAYVHDLVLPGMLHGRVVRPPSPGSVLETVDAHALDDSGLDVTIVRNGGFLGVVAAYEYAAVRGAELLAQQARWSTADVPFQRHDMAAWLKAQPVDTVELQREGDPNAAPGETFRYTRPYLAHASIGPSCAVAQWRADALEVWSHSQGIFNLRADLALALGRTAPSIDVNHVEGAGCYGHNGADDVALDAALLARAVPGHPVKVVWSRQDELARAPFGPGTLVEIAAALEGDGRIGLWRHAIWSNGHSLRPGRAETPTLLAAAEMEDGFVPRVAINAALAAGGGSERNAIPFYAISNRSITNHRVLVMPVRTSALRSLGALANVFAIESTIDELAERAQLDPLEFRLRNLENARGRRVLEAAAAAGQWSDRKAMGEARGRGLAVAHYKNSGAYCAAVVDVDLSVDVRVVRIVIAVDVGMVINPDGVKNQIAGGAIQATSWALLEEVRFEGDTVATSNWEQYPILRFSEVPAVEVHIVDSAVNTPVGAGEAAQGPVVAAIANAVKHAIGVRVFDLPITRERVAAAP